MNIIKAPKLSNGDEIIPIICNKNKIIIQKQGEDNIIKGFYEFDIDEVKFKEIFTLKNEQNYDKHEMFRMGYHDGELLKTRKSMYVDVIEHEDKMRIKFYEINLTTYNTKLIFEYLINPGFYYKGISYLKDDFFIFELGNEIKDDTENTLLFLYDVKEEKVYPILEDSFRTTSSYYRIFSKDEVEYLFFDEWYIDYYEEEEIILEQKDFEYLNNSFKIIEVDKFIQQIKAGNKNIDYTVIDSAKTDGWIRYCGMNEKNLYYTRKLYEKGNIEIVSVSKNDFKSTSIKNLNEIDNPYHVCINSQDNYIVEDIDNRLGIKSLSTDAVVYTYLKDEKSKWESFHNIVNDTYLVVSGEKENEDTEYFKIINMMNNEMISARGIWVQDDTMVLT